MIDWNSIIDWNRFWPRRSRPSIVQLAEILLDPNEEPGKIGTIKIPTDPKTIKEIKKLIPEGPPKEDLPDDPTTFQKFNRTFESFFEKHGQQIGSTMVTTGLGLLNPIDPGPHILSPVDEIIGFGLIFGGIIFQIAY